jgi:malic enzyme
MVGKLALYCAAGGIAPHRVLPVTLDVGTNNKSLLDSPDYIGLRHERIQGAEYLDMIDEFVSAVFYRWPNVVLQFEVHLSYINPLTSIHFYFIDI